MRGKIRQWFVDNPRAMTAAYFLLMSSTMFAKIGLRDASGTTMGP